MIELAFVVCLRAAPAQCEERHLAYVENTSMMSCLMTAQPQLASWIESHPEQQIARWRCQPVGSGGMKA